MADNYVDFSEIYKALNNLGKNADREINNIMAGIAPDVAKELSKRVPYWDGSKDKMVGARGTYMQEHMRDHVVYGKPKDGYVEIGFDDEVAWRIHFTEFGTIKQRPQHFVEKTLQDVKNEVQSRIEKELARRLL